MAFLPSLSDQELNHFHRVVTLAVDVRSHFDVLTWLQGDVQRYLPHDILIAAWGHFDLGAIRHDIVSALPGVRSRASNPDALAPLLLTLFGRWTESDKQPFVLSAGQGGFVLQDQGQHCALGAAMQTMRSAIVHGITDERSNHHCLYVAFSARENVSDAERGAMAVALPYIDSALRRVTHLPHQAYHQAGAASTPAAQAQPAHDLTEREAEVLSWVTLGKTNPEIGSILSISEFTVKNHMQRVFKKLEVNNRAQAVGKFHSLVGNA